jgi:hypothetical protein
MVRHKFLLILSVATGLTIGTVHFGAGAAWAQGGTCAGPSAITGSCSGAQVSSNSVDVWANQSRGGANVEGATWGGIAATPAAAGGGGGVPWSFYPRIPDSAQQARGYCYVLVNRAASCFRVATPATEPVVEVAFVAPRVTITDISSFSPQQPTLATEPRGWTVVGLETNMIVGTSMHVVSGTLLGEVAEVRFTPVSFDFSYGDGATRGALSSGATWAAQGLAEFAPTATSHRFAQKGSFRPSVRVGFALEYRWASGGWTPIDGRLFGSAVAPLVLVVNATNVLVTESCQPGIPAPGC